MSSTYRNCMVCGKEFKVCNTCVNRSAPQIQWRQVVCCREHFAYHMPIIQYVRHIIDKDEAKQELNYAFNEYGYVNFAEEIKPVVSEIYDGNVPFQNDFQKKDFEIVQEDSTEEDSTETENINQTNVEKEETIISEISDINYNFSNDTFADLKKEYNPSDSYKKKRK